MSEEQRKAPRVFISYSHDSLEHRNRAFRLCEELRRSLIDASIDQYEEEAPPQDWPTWMFQQLDGADYVIMICTEPYKRRAHDQEEPGKGLGARFETSIITNAIYRTARLAATSPYIPVIFDKKDRDNVPYFVAGSTNYLLDAETWEGLDPVVRRIKGERRVVRLPLGGHPEPEAKVPQTLQVTSVDQLSVTDNAEAKVLRETTSVEDRSSFLLELLERWTNMSDLRQAELVRGLTEDERQVVLALLPEKERDRLARQNRAVDQGVADLSDASMRRLKGGSHYPHPLGEVQENERRALKIVQTDLDLEAILFDGLAAAQRHKPNSDLLFLHLDRVSGQFSRIVGEQLDRPVSVEIWHSVPGSRPWTARCLASDDTPVLTTIAVNSDPDFAQASINGFSHTKERMEFPHGSEDTERTTYGIKVTQQDKLPIGWLRTSWFSTTGDGQFLQIVAQHLVSRLAVILDAMPSNVWV